MKQSMEYMYLSKLVKVEMKMKGTALSKYLIIKQLFISILKYNKRKKIKITLVFYICK